MSFVLGFIYNQFFLEPPKPTKSFKGKTIIVTGSNIGLGKEASRWITQLGASRVILACRNVDKGNAAAKDIQQTTSCPPDTLQVWPLDMSSYASVQAFADRAKAELPRLDAVIANAGVSANSFRITEQDEETITTNVVSTVLLAFLLHSKLRDTAQKYNSQTHFTITSSELHGVARFKERNGPPGQIFANLNNKSMFNGVDRYSTSKLLEVFTVKQMATLSPLSSNGVIVNCVAPGFCHSGLNRERESLFLRAFTKLMARTTEIGSRNLVAGIAVGPESHGQYVHDTKIRPTGGLAKGKKGEELQVRFWAELRDKLESIVPGVTDLEASRKL